MEGKNVIANFINRYRNIFKRKAKMVGLIAAGGFFIFYLLVGRRRYR